jgi:hypothetical protein
VLHQECFEPTYFVDVIRAVRLLAEKGDVGYALLGRCEEQHVQEVVRIANGSMYTGDCGHLYEALLLLEVLFKMARGGGASNTHTHLLAKKLCVKTGMSVGLMCLRVLSHDYDGQFSAGGMRGTQASSLALDLLRQSTGLAPFNLTSVHRKGVVNRKGVVHGLHRAVHKEGVTEEAVFSVLEGSCHVLKHACAGDEAAANGVCTMINNSNFLWGNRGFLEKVQQYFPGVRRDILVEGTNV